MSRRDGIRRWVTDSLRTALVSAVVAGSFSLVVAETTGANQETAARVEASAAAAEADASRDAEDQEEVESIVCSEVFARVQEQVKAKPDLAILILSTEPDGATFQNSEEREACPLAIRPIIDDALRQAGKAPP